MRFYENSLSLPAVNLHTGSKSGHEAMVVYQKLALMRRSRNFLKPISKRFYVHVYRTGTNLRLALNKTWI